jgi:hypothetical protein
MGDSKQGALVSLIANAVHAVHADDRAANAKGFAEMSVLLHAICARLETLEATRAPPPDGKRGVCVGGGGAPPGGKSGKGGKASKDAAGSAARVSNGLLYFRYALAHNLEDIREVYGTDENLNEAAADPAVAKQDRAKDEAAYFSAVGAYLWKSVLSEDQKTEMRNQFAAWKAQRVRDDTEPSLQEEEVL